ncbi:RidA family protein [Hyphomonadaceae bacterium BL14]|nr:RidA family protein [Hyphomonadaceae bacterium BL14]
MTSGRQRISSGAPWEDRVGYRRAVRVGNLVWVSGTVAVDPQGDPFAPGDAGAQAARCLEIIVAALEQAGARPEHVVRTRMFVTDMAPETQAAVGAAHRSVFADCPPASTMVGVTALAAPEFVVEIEAEAVIG